MECQSAGPESRVVNVVAVEAVFFVGIGRAASWKYFFQGSNCLIS